MRHENLEWFNIGPLYDDVLKKAGEPWLRFGVVARIVDVAVHTVFDELFVVVVIRKFSCVEGIEDCSNPQFSKPDKRAWYEVWQTVRHASGSWDRFREVTRELNAIQLSDVALGGDTEGGLFLVGATRGGGVGSAIRTTGDTAWRARLDVKAAAAFDPGRVTRVAGATFGDRHAVAMVADARVWLTFIDEDGFGYQSHNGNIRGMVDITARTGIPDPVAEVDLAHALFVRSRLHLVATSREGRQWHTLLSPSGLDWTNAGDIAQVAGNPGRIRSAGISSFGDELHLYDVVDTGDAFKLFSAIRHFSGDWSGFESLPAPPAEVGPFLGVAAAEFDDIPQRPDLLEVKGVPGSCDISVSWRDKSTFEKGYRIEFGDTLVGTTGPLNGGRGNVTVLASQIEAGRTYNVAVVPFTDTGRNLAVVGYRTVSRATAPNVLIGAKPLATWTYVPNSSGLNTNHGQVKVRAVSAAGRVVESPWLPAGTTQFQFPSSVNTALESFTVKVQVTDFLCTTESEPTTTGTPVTPKPKANLVFGVSPITCRPELLSCTLFPNPKLKEQFKVFWRVCNAGLAPADGSSTRLLQQSFPEQPGPDPSQSEMFFSTRSLKVGECQEQSVNFTATDPGQYHWNVTLDAGTEVDEISDLDNSGGVSKSFFKQW
jgi:hypothetical protein